MLLLDMRCIVTHTAYVGRGFGFRGRPVVTAASMDAMSRADDEMAEVAGEGLPKLSLSVLTAGSAAPRRGAGLPGGRARSQLPVPPADAPPAAHEPAGAVEPPEGSPEDGILPDLLFSRVPEGTGRSQKRWGLGAAPSHELCGADPRACHGYETRSRPSIRRPLACANNGWSLDGLG
jgi:hypothetical protein